MGTVGGGGKREFTVLGDTVNVAFRLEGMAGKLNVEFLVSAATAEHIKDAWRLKNLGRVNVEGRSGEIVVFTLEQ
jgi:adenylate cyclase